MQNSTNLCERVNVVRSSIPAVTHVDYSARVQTVDAIRNPRFYGLLKAFYAQTGCPVLVNTSFNVRGEPIVCTPQDAYRCFLSTDMDALVLGHYIIRKEKLKPTALVGAADRQRHLAQFQLD
jgi:carbamoyltransferase